MSGTGQNTSGFEVVTLLASLGGLAAVTEVLRGLPPTFPARVVVVQHGRQDTEHRLASILATHTALPVETARDGSRLGDGPGVVVVPTGWSATIDADRTLTLTDVEPSCSGDDLLASLAPVLGSGLIAAVLTGRLSDGARGVRAVKRHGGRVVAQDPTSARSPGMPTAAIATGCVDFVLPLRRIAHALVSLVMAPGGADLLSVATPPWARLRA